MARKTRQYGFFYRHSLKKVVPWSHEIPQEYRVITNRLEERLGVRFSQLTINKYAPDQGIGLHVDDPSFGPVVVSISLGSRCVMDFRIDKGLNCSRSYILKPKSLLVLESDARHIWRNGIQANVVQKDG